MKDDFRCEDNAALIGFLYDDCDADEQARIAAHLAVCPTCAGEIAALSATREHLSAWTPPDAALGFRMNQAGAAAWWFRPMPAWAQLAAAVVIFAAGTAVGLGTAGRVSVAGVDPVVAAATRADLGRLEQRLKRVEDRPAGQVASVKLDEAAREALLMNVSRLVRDSVLDSEKRMQRELAYRLLNSSADYQNELEQHLSQRGDSGANVMRIGFTPRGAGVE